MNANSLSALPVLPCDICGEQIDTLRLIKWREHGLGVIRYWVCLDCWKKIYHSERADDGDAHQKIGFYP